MATRVSSMRRPMIAAAALLGAGAGYALGYHLLLDWVGQQAHAVFWYQARLLLETESFYRILVPTLLGAALAGVGSWTLLRRR